MRCSFWLCVEACQEEYVGIPIFTTSALHHGSGQSYHAGYRSENALFREMVSEFIPPSWAKLVIVGGDAAYGSKANMRMVHDRDKADPARRWGPNNIH